MNSITFKHIKLSHIIAIFLLSAFITIIYYFTSSKSHPTVKYLITTGYKNTLFRNLKENIVTEFSPHSNLIVSSIDSVNHNIVRMKIFGTKKDSSLIIDVLKKITDTQNKFQRYNSSNGNNKVEVTVLDVKILPTSYNEKVLDTVSIFLLTFLSAVLLLFILGISSDKPHQDSKNQ